MKLYNTVTVSLILSTAICLCTATPIFEWFRNLGRKDDDLSRYGPVTVFMDPYYGGSYEFRFPATALRNPPPTVASERLLSLNGKVVEAMHHFIETRVYVRVSKVQRFLIDNQEAYVPIKCSYYVGSARDASDGSMNNVRDVFGFINPGMINTRVNGIRCFAWVGGETLDPNDDDQRAEIDALLLRYIDGVPDEAVNDS